MIRKKILGKGSTQGLENTTLTAEKEYAINFSEQHKKICLSSNYNGVNSYLFVVLLLFFVVLLLF